VKLKKTGVSKKKMMNLIKQVIYWGGHPALGAMTLAAGYLHPVYAALWVWLYLKYEINEDKWIKDKAYIDVKDFMQGFGAAFSVVFVWEIFIGRLL
jgi:hypothetical protein